MGLKIQKVLSISVILIFSISIIQFSNNYVFNDISKINSLYLKVKFISITDKKDLENYEIKKKRSHHRRRKVKPIKENK